MIPEAVRFVVSDLTTNGAYADFRQERDGE